jgi:ABC-type branched-subunit amino acid transport system substrate-binding protein
VTKYVFSNSAGREYATSAIDYAVNKLGAQRIAAIHYGTDFSSQIPDAITGKCEELGCEIVAIEEAAADAPVDALIPQLTNMRNADPDVYYLEGLNPNVFAAARQLGIDAPIVSEQWLAVPALRDACGENCAGVTFGIHKCNVPELLQEDDELRQLCEDYRESYLSEYDPWAGFSIYGRDAVYTYAAAVEALLEAGEELTRDNIAAQMEKFDGSLLTTHGAIETSPESHRLTGTWTEGYIDVAIEMQDGQPTWVLAPDADPEGSTP